MHLTIERAVGVLTRVFEPVNWDERDHLPDYLKAGDLNDHAKLVHEHSCSQYLGQYLAEFGFS